MTSQSTNERSIDHQQYTSSEPEDIKPHISSGQSSTPKKKKIQSNTSKEKTPTLSPSPRKDESNGVPEGWSPQNRLDLFEAVLSTVEIRWDEVAAKMGLGYTGKQCREQWQRATGKRIRKALSEE